MVGILVVSHSWDAAVGICDIAAEMGSEDTAIVPVGGGPDDRIGTVVDDITAALGTIEDMEVVVLVDLGSAVMNAEAAIESFQGKAVIADAPLLEGALNATVEAASPKATLDSVVNAAEEARELSKL
ncbi:PTS-dependent dihydroxyacetone kinase phosphotransferase subunit DhaM [Halocatena salina]|uniref:PTS mannose transporter subunit IID n=1 Tax=Halocatena salina TaxID=2934340 RepID=A0A8U0AA34_9EURY|nr:PTS mannose transporter subunit IID [Halocatena salina]UPM44813.1 PTS mannose transporter subunit IID [Halocatena salina]